MYASFASRPRSCADLLRQLLATLAPAAAARRLRRPGLRRRSRTPAAVARAAFARAGQLGADLLDLARRQQLDQLAVLLDLPRRLAGGGDRHGDVLLRVDLVLVPQVADARRRSPGASGRCARPPRANVADLRPRRVDQPLARRAFERPGRPRFGRTSFSFHQIVSVMNGIIGCMQPQRRRRAPPRARSRSARRAAGRASRA